MNYDVQLGAYGHDESSEEDEEDKNQREALKTVKGKLERLTYILTKKSPKSAFDCLQFSLLDRNIEYEDLEKNWALTFQQASELTEEETEQGLQPVSFKAKAELLYVK